jgi:DNA polymerase II small subunit/DNA polymerase delta subunit B
MIAIIGGLVYAYKEKELEMEEKRMGSSRELNEMRKIVHNLKSRIENLEAIVTEEGRKPSGEPANSLSDIEIEDEVESQNSDNTGSKRKTRA